MGIYFAEKRFRCDGLKYIKMYGITYFQVIIRKAS